MQSLFRRKSAASLEPAESLDPVDADVVDEPVASVPRAYTPKKGEATPKRSPARRQADPPPANRKEALARLRAKQREQRVQQRAGALAGDDRYLMRRDKGPVRALVRDVVDSRRNLISYFMFTAAFLFIVITNPTYSATVQLVAWTIWLVMMVDTIFLCRKVGRVIRQRHADPTEPMRRLYFYAGTRAMYPRMMRMPKPRIKIGQAY